MASNFIKPTLNPPTFIGRLSVTFATENDSSPVEGSVTFQILDDKGKVISSKADELIQHMSPAQQTAITNFLSQLRTKVVNEVI